jgi:hypothetical protein
VTLSPPRLLAFPGPGLALYKKCIQLETLAETNGAESGMERRRPLFEAALEVHSQVWDLWLEYCRQEMQVSTASVYPNPIFLQCVFSILERLPSSESD